MLTKLLTIIFETHGTSVDNKAAIASGWRDSRLSALGRVQARELGERYKNESLDAVFCSDLKRAYETAEIAFSGRDIPIIKDPRQRECDYGDLTGHPSAEVERVKANHISLPFPNGESYAKTADRMKDFLEETFKNYNGKRILIIGHRATQYGLEHWINKIALEEAVTAPWKWQAGWTYHLQKI